MVYESEFFSIKDTLECGQIFRFKPYKDGYLVFSSDKACYAYEKSGKTMVESDDEEYFDRFFDSATDYSSIYNFAKSSGFSVVKDAAEFGKGIRILRQNAEETLYSFIISQNNNIPRIKGTIERTCRQLGKKKSFLGEEYYAFPTTKDFLTRDENFYKENGYGYRAGYMTAVAEAIEGGFDINSLASLDTAALKRALIGLKGVGPKVADCVSLFGYHRTDSFPVDTWIEKLYREDFGGALTDRKKITDFFLSLFGDNSGYIQQYVFYYKRSNN